MKAHGKADPCPKRFFVRLEYHPLGAPWSLLARNSASRLTGMFFLWEAKRLPVFRRVPGLDIKTEYVANTLLPL